MITTGGSRRRRPRGRVVGRLARACALGGLLGACFGGCFVGDFLAYTPCGSSESCRDAGLVACVVRPERGGAAGFCAPACEEPCPPGIDGDATPTCQTIDGTSLCVLACDGGLACPTDMTCARITTSAGGRADLCFPEETP